MKQRPDFHETGPPCVDAGELFHERVIDVARVGASGLAKGEPVVLSSPVRIEKSRRR
jgi:hypothetical protein